MNVGSLFSGIGGFDLAAQWCGWETKWYSEIDPYACRVMQKHFPRAYNVGDITTWEPVADAEGSGTQTDGGTGRREKPNGKIALTGQANGGRQDANERSGDSVDIICGGFPCQPVSVAGKQLAQDDPRWLWPHFARVIRALRPRYVVVENVSGLLVRGGFDVLGDLAAIGLTAEWETISAAAVGAPHRRDRVWIVAYPDESDWRTSRQSENQRPPTRLPVCASEQDATPLADTSGEQRGKPQTRDGREVSTRGGTTNLADAVRRQRDCGTRGQPRRDAATQSGEQSGRTKDVANAEHDQSHESESQDGPTDKRSLTGWAEHRARGGGDDVADAKDTHGRRADGTQDAGRRHPEARGRGVGGRGIQHRPTQPPICGMADGLPEGLHGGWEREWEGVPRVATGIPERVNRLKCLGNSIVPQIAYWIFQQIEKAEA